jgi:hypothetical protein
VYINLLHTKQPLELHFKPMVNGFAGNVLRVEPDILPPGSVKISEVWVDNHIWQKFDAEKLTVELPKVDHRPKIKVRLIPTS